MLAQLRHGAPTPGAQVFAADLLYVSSHGWLGGFAGGFLIEEWPDAKPALARRRYDPSKYYAVGELAHRNEGFAGPKWIILAQCSTLNSATWPLWARVLANSNPHVRGILGYEEASPFPTGAAFIAEKFFANLDNKETFLEAWKNANSGQHWAAVVHKDALGDRLDQWRNFAELADVSTTDTVSNYRGFLSSVSRVENIVEPLLKFKLTLKSSLDGKTFNQITSANLQSSQIAAYGAGRTYRMKIHDPPPGEVIVKVIVTWIHIRPTHGFKPTIDQLFADTKAPGTDAVATIIPGKQTLDILPLGAHQTEITLDLVAPNTITHPKIEAHHSYFWPRIELVTNATPPGKPHKFDFKTTGLVYWGHCNCSPP
ncbi:hypothetical protein LVJ94_03220 [Pendulispora rubella]|uniref:F5/8 type C domain-containing protein n=1 Tax=Pendulispora rubella TaxID=2741070 RepID=A0ABZ2L670_9BACT